VYLVHGLLGTAYAHFGAQITGWRGRYQVVPVDMPGHGRCPVAAGEPYLVGALDYLTAVVRRFGPGRVIGASYLGGPLAVRLAAARPDLVDSLVLTGFAPGLAEDVFLRWVAGFQLLAERGTELAAEYDRLHGPGWRGTLLAFTADVGRAYRQRAEVRPESLGALEMDVLIVNGSLKSVERAAAAGAHTFGPNVSGLVIEGAGHIASHDAPAAFNRAVERFWDRRSRHDRTA
jgi:pimeloyl-ACP methyl ester carboxylesterase